MIQIREMVIKDSPTFKSLTLEFSGGLNVISGPSGAGKSVFFASLLALFGLKDCNASVIEGILEGEVDLGEYLEEEELSIQILKKDKTRYFINHQSTSKRRLGEIFSPCVKFLSHKNSNELESDFLLHLLSRIIPNSRYHQALDEFQETFLELQSLQAQLKEFQEEENRVLELKEFARFEIEKIESIAPKSGEYEELLRLKKILSKKEKLYALAQEAFGVVEQMHKVGAFLEATEVKLDHYDEVIGGLESLIESEMEKLDHLSEEDPEVILDRLSKLSSLISRYGGIEEALQHAEIQKQKLQTYDNIDAMQDELKAKIQTLQAKLNELSPLLSQERQKYLPALQEEIEKYASLLRLNAVKLTLSPSTMQKNGSDFLEIKLANSAPQTLSSGEYNRLRLAILATCEGDKSAILLLDEIDANLSGEESEGVAKVLQKLSSSYQVFAISHQPHLPSLADSHFVVQKEQSGSMMKKLDQEGRILEIARMVSGSTLTQEALDFARKKVEMK